MRLLQIRLLAVAAVAVPATVAVVAFPPSSGAATPTTCTSVVGTVSGLTARLEGCTRATTGGSGILKGTAGVDTVAWRNGGTTTIQVRSENRPKRVFCPSGYSDLLFRGKVTSSTGAARAIRGTVSADLCIAGTRRGKVKVLPGTVWRF